MLKVEIFASSLVYKGFIEENPTMDFVNVFIDKQGFIVLTYREEELKIKTPNDIRKELGREPIENELKEYTIYKEIGTDRRYRLIRLGGDGPWGLTPKGHPAEAIYKKEEDMKQFLRTFFIEVEGLELLDTDDWLDMGEEKE